MRSPDPRIRTMKASEARAQWSRLLNAVFRGEQRVVIEKSGIPVAAIVSASDLERLLRLGAAHERDFAILNEIGEAFRGVPPDELEQEVDRAVTEARAEMRGERYGQAVRPATP